MKKSISILLVSIFSLVLITLFGGENEKKNLNTTNSALRAGGMENPGARAAWDLQRLADPSGKIPAGIRAKELAYAANLPQGQSYKTDSLTTPWSQEGPWNIGGRTRAFAMDVTNSNVLLAGGVSGGIWRSTDNGSAWNRVTPAGAYPGVNDLAQDTRSGKTDIWYALSGEAYGTSASGGSAFYLGDGINKSTDGGLTWNALPSTQSGTPQTFDNAWDATWNLALDPSESTNDELYAAILGAIMRSTNGGTSWTKVRGSVTTNLSYFTNVMCTPDSGVVYATLSSDGANKGIWRSENGTSWTNIDPPFMPAYWGRIVSGYNPLNQDQVYFVAANVDTSGKLTRNFRGDPEWNSLWRYTFLSGNGTGSGGKWENLSENLPASGGPFDEFILQGGYNMLVRVNPNDTNMVIIGGTNLYRSTTAFNDSLNTTHIGGYAVGASTPKLILGIYPNQHPDHHVLFFHPTLPNRLYSANDGGLFMTNDLTASTVNWTQLNNGYLVSQFYSVAMDHGTMGDNTIIGGLQDNGTWFSNSTNLTDPWVFVSGGDGSYCHIENGGGHHYYSKQLGKIAKCTTNSTGQVTAFERIDPIGAKNQGFINPFVMDPNDQNVMYFPAGRQVWRNSDLSAISLNNGWDSIATNWTVMSDTVPGSSRTITAIGISANPANRIYVGTNERSIYRIDNADSTNPSWQYVSSTQMATTGYISCLAVHPDDGDKVMAVFSNYGIYSVFYTEDAGASWTKVAGNLEQFVSGGGNGPSVRWAEILPLATGDVYLVGTSTGLYGTDSLADALTTVWTQLGAGNVGNAVIDMIKYRRSDGKTLLATHGAGIWSADFPASPFISRDPIVNSPNTHLTVFPNPIVETSTILLELSESGNVSLELVGINGKLVRQIFQGVLAQGQNQIEINTQDLSPGIYFCQANGKGWRKTFKVLLR